MYFVDPEKMTVYNEGSIPAVIRNHERVAEYYQLPSLNLAMEVTERQFMRLVGGCNRIAQFYVYPFTLPEIPRGQARNTRDREELQIRRAPWIRRHGSLAAIELCTLTRSGIRPDDGGSP